MKYISLLILLFLLSFTLTSCCKFSNFLPKKTPVESDKSDYIGKWKSEDNDYIVIQKDGTGGFKSGNKEIDGGSVKITEKHITISLFGFEKKFKITSPPEFKNGKWKMVLDDTEFFKVPDSENGIEI